VAQAVQDAGQVTIRDTAVEFRQFDTIEITGSALRRAAESRALPVEIITRADIRKTGLTQTSDLIQSLPYMGNMIEAGQFLASNGGFANAAIHGMPNATLVLVNGMRIAPYGRQSIAGGERTGVDLDNIPISAIDRIEVLSDGASSLYGTDALACVVNIIMNEERKGISISADKTRPAGGAAQTESLSVQLAKGSLRRDG
jgi:iron complex outermembrane receptor protein